MIQDLLPGYGRAFIAWANRIGLRRQFPDLNIGELYDAQEVSMMLANPNSDWTLKWKREGRMAGRKEGRKEGHQEGRIEERTQTLLRLLRRRFGQDLPDWVDKKIHDATAEQLEAWTDAILDATTLQALFGDEQRPGND
jgi:hypothetical protein